MWNPKKQINKALGVSESIQRLLRGKIKMRYEIEVPDYTNETGIKMNWDYGFTIDGRIANNTVVIKANKEGLISLARHLLNLSQEAIPSGYHFHLDESNSLEDGSCEIIVEKL